MSTTTTSVPVSVDPGATTHAARLGLLPVLDQLVEQMKSMAPELLRITVTLECSAEDPTEEPQILIQGVEALDARPADDLSLKDAYRQWVIETYPPQVTTHFAFFLYPGGDADGR